MKKIYFKDLQNDFMEPVRELEDFLGFCSVREEEAQIILTMQPSEKGLAIEVSGSEVKISFQRKVELFRGLALLMEEKDNADEISEYQINEIPNFSHLTYMQDNSRNAVSNLPSVKKMIRHLALMGFDSYMLYTEDTYEVAEYPFFGYMRGRFTGKELREINHYAAMFGIEMVPCIQTLAHLNAPFGWSAFDEVKDVNDILLCGEPKTYEFIEAMIKTCAESFTSRRINIGMDEAEMLGLGQYLRRNGYKERFDIMMSHLKKVLEICDKYGMQAMMWSDMFFKMLSEDSDNYYAEVKVSDQIKNLIPKNVELIYWDYFTREKEIYDSMILRHKMLTDQIGFAGGAWRWTGYAPLLYHSIEASKLALTSCIEHGISNILVTGWGDNGSEASSFVVGPVLQWYAEICYRKEISEEQVAKRLMTCTHMNYYDFLELDKLNYTPDNPAPGRSSIAPARYTLYQDLLIGLFDSQIDEATYPAHYKTCYETLSQIARKSSEYSYLFDTLAKLSHVLELKCDMGIRLKKAYDKQDKETLEKIASKDLPELLTRVEVFHEAHRYQWYTESKPFGFEVLDLRLGGLKERIKATIWRLEEYLGSKIDRIEELEQERLPLDGRTNLEDPSTPVYANEWRTMVTASVL